MSTFRKSVIASLVGISLLTSGSLMAQSNKGNNKPTAAARCDVGRLNLTDAQKKQIEQLKPKRGSGFQGDEQAQMRQEREAYLQQSNILIQQKNFDENKAQALINAQINKDSGRQAQRKLAQMKMRHEFFQILDKKQQEVWLKECRTDRLPIDSIRAR